MVGFREGFGRQIRSARKTARLSREAVAEKAKIKPNYLGEIERGEKWPSLDVIVRIAQGIGVSPAFFLEFDQPITDPKIVRDHITHHLLNMDVEQLHTVLRLLRALTGGFSQ
jgi:transcriptional regulator with XRE-family HTH domain